MKLNLGCGLCKLPGYINIDIDISVKPDLVTDFKTILPFSDNTIDRVLLIHTIEHIPRFYHIHIYSEIHRILKPNGEFILAYPEFERCAKNWISNFQGKRDFWEATLYGRQTSKADFHVCAMNTIEVLDNLRLSGFVNLVSSPEQSEDFNTFIKAYKGNLLPTWAEHIKKEVFG